MKMGETKLRIDVVSHDDTGTRVEPEEQPATEITAIPVDVGLADHAAKPGEVPNVASLRGSMNIESTAGEVAQDVSTRCELCEHWRQDDWTKHLDSIADTHEGRQQLDKLRGTLLGYGYTTGGENPIDIDDHDLAAVNIIIRRQFGICAAFTESEGIIVGAAYHGGCPANDPRFKMRDRSAARVASAGYDRILRLAQGKE